MKKIIQKKISETDLSKPVKEYFQSLGYDVHGEVKSCDITAIKGEELIVAELKLGFNLQLLYQATQRQYVADKVFVVIPRPKKGKWAPNWDKMCHLLRRLEIGLMIVHFNQPEPILEVVFEPASFQMIRKKKKRDLLIKETSGRNLDLNQGGSVKKKLMTAYKDSSIHIACCLVKYGPLSASALRKMGTTPKTHSILYQNFNGWFDKIEKGIYGINSKGIKELGNYANLVEVYQKLI